MKLKIGLPTKTLKFFKILNFGNRYCEAIRVGTHKTGLFYKTIDAASKVCYIGRKIQVYISENHDEINNLFFYVSFVDVDLCIL